VALVLGAVSAAAALYGRYRVLPAWLTGPAVCRLEAGGCQVLFRTKQAALVVLPNAAWGLALYAAVAIGLALAWPPWLLVAGAAPALAMSVYLATYLVRNELECRICWAGHLANAALFAALLVRAVT
jgi:uncharacterized membrane protein